MLTAAMRMLWHPQPEQWPPPGAQWQPWPLQFAGVHERVQASAHERVQASAHPAMLQPTTFPTAAIAYGPPILKHAAPSL